MVKTCIVPNCTKKAELDLKGQSHYTVEKLFCIVHWQAYKHGIIDKTGNRRGKRTD